jgi:hypothetical protein
LPAVDLAACERNLAESLEAAVRWKQRILLKFKTNEPHFFLKFERSGFCRHLISMRPLQRRAANRDFWASASAPAAGGGGATVGNRPFTMPREWGCKARVKELKRRPVPRPGRHLSVRLSGL